MMVINNLVNRIWYENHPAALVLLPLSWIYAVVIKFRQFLYQSGFIATIDMPVPVIVIGNITVGGTGKTPLVIWLSTYLSSKGYRPGILSRGYGGSSGLKVQQVRADSDPLFVGDEPVLIAKRTGQPVAVSKDRCEAARQLIENANCDILICDDGLQYLALNSDLDVAVIDGERIVGNGNLLPAGPLREPIKRLADVDILLSNGKSYKNSYVMNYQYGELTLLTDETKKLSVSELSKHEIHVVTGIANPDRFHAYLQGQGIQLIKHVFPDHYQYHSHDLLFGDDKPVVMTEKDAVKCTRFANNNMWYLPIQTTFNDSFIHKFETLLRDKTNGQEIT